MGDRMQRHVCWIPWTVVKGSVMLFCPDPVFVCECAKLFESILTEDAGGRHFPQTQQVILQNLANTALTSATMCCTQLVAMMTRSVVGGLAVYVIDERGKATFERFDKFANTAWTLGSIAFGKSNVNARSFAYTTWALSKLHVWNVA